MKCAANAEQVGWKLNVDLAKECAEKLLIEQSDKVTELKSVMPMRKLMQEKVKPKVCYKKMVLYLLMVVVGLIYYQITTYLQTMRVK